MSTHPDPERLAALATGAAPDPDLAAHLASCAECTAELDGLRELTGRLAGLEPVEWLEPPATVGAAVLAAARGETPPRPRRWLLVAAAAAVGVVVGVLGGRTLWPAAVQPAPEVVLAMTRLDTLDTGVQEGTATLVQTPGGVELRVVTSPFSAGAGYLEVWLINTDGKRMVSVGILSNGTSGTFPVARGLIDAGYLIVDISREGLDDKPQHSGDSVVRGKLSL
ncbi:MAG TPA: anti-sigma factor [Propionicimonas sp.]